MEKILHIALSRIEPNPFQPRKRFDADYLKGLANSIDKEGLLQPITVRKNQAKKGWYQIVAGECRVRASRMIAGAKQIKAQIRSATDQEMKRIASLENMARNDMNPIEEAQAVRNLLDDGLDISEIAKTVGRRAKDLEMGQNLLKLLPELQGEVAFGRIPKKLGIAMGHLAKSKQMRAYQVTKTKILEKALAMVHVMAQEQMSLSLFELTPLEIAKSKEIDRRLIKFRCETDFVFRAMKASDKALIHAMSRDPFFCQFMNDLAKEWVRIKKEVLLCRTQIESAESQQKGGKS